MNFSLRSFIIVSMLLCTAITRQLLPCLVEFSWVNLIEDSFFNKQIDIDTFESQEEKLYRAILKKLRALPLDSTQEDRIRSLGTRCSPRSFNQHEVLGNCPLTTKHFNRKVARFLSRIIKNFIDNFKKNNTSTLCIPRLYLIYQTEIRNVCSPVMHRLLVVEKSKYVDSKKYENSEKLQKFSLLENIRTITKASSVINTIYKNKYLIGTLTLALLAHTALGKVLPIDGDQTAHLSCEAIEELATTCEEWMLSERIIKSAQLYLELFFPEELKVILDKGISFQQITNLLFYTILHCQSEECIEHQLNSITNCFSRMTDISCPASL